VSRLVPFPGVHPRIAWLRAILLGACGFGLLASAPLWLSSRQYPLLPVAGWFPILPPPWDKWFFSALVFALLLAWRWYRGAVIFFLCGSLFLALGDQSRWQPWFYLYWVMLFLTLAEPPAVLAGCRLAFSAVYFWAGVQKCNAKFFTIGAPWFVKPAAAWFPASVVTMLQWTVASAPLLEVFISLALWFPRSQRAALGAILCIHLSSLLFLGPLGHKHNLIVWPWNLAMPALAGALFLASGPLGATLANLRHSARNFVVVALFCCLPGLSFFGWWDSYLSFSVYSANLAEADLFVSDALRQQLPPEVRAFVHPTPVAFDPRLQGPYVLVLQLWAESELKVPPLPEPRGYRAIGRYVAGYASGADDVHLLVAPRGSAMKFYNAADLR